MNVPTLAFMVLLLVALAGCAPPPSADGTPTMTSPAYTTSTYDARYGVVCYRYTPSSYNLSCVKVD